MRIKKVLLTLFSILFLLAIFPSTTRAYYSCAWVGTPPVGPLPAIGSCRVGAVSCTGEDFVPASNACAGKSYAFCVAGGHFDCASASTGCAAQGGYPNTGSCPSNSSPIPCADCTSPFICCKPTIGGGYFDCSWNGNACVTSNVTCADGTSPPGGLCAAATNSLLCGAFQNLPCTLNGGSMIGVSSGPPIANCGGVAGFETSIGCIPIIGDGTADALAGFFLNLGLSLGGGLAFILIVVAGYKIISSAGDPERLQSGKELLTSALTGLLLLVFSAFILRFIGVDFLGIF